MADVHYTVSGGTARITICRPERANALSNDVLVGLVEHLERAAGDNAVRVVAITGEGAVFCAGRDLKEESGGSGNGAFSPLPMRGVHRNVLEVLLEVPKPTLAIVNGPAVAGGCELALACDLRVVSDQAFFQLPEAKRGLAANFASVVLAGMVPRGVAAEWLFTGRRIPAAEAWKWGLVNRVAGPDEVARAAESLVAEIVDNAPLSLQRMKEMMVKSVGLPVPAALRIGSLGSNPYSSLDRAEGARAYFEKRAPQWEGR
ncbi:enoyl-CoA hydratase/isomerase family protein [Amycolatopsis pigmentata]|uniref:Enoyl-CoA hydratase/isomerase family protein n=1 Tax=Amycolatopsis pigmentata TaxID=450801 RepID=A0ABW5G375_9PSEU